MTASVSVVVVSRDRPDALFRCVLGLSQVQYEPFEIVVVADAVGLAALEHFDSKIKIILFEEPNISAARNLGVSHSAGEVIAFIDDDAVPEPTWLFHLTAPFERQDVATVGGFVIGRNGISFQWKARVLDRDGFATNIEVDEVQPTVLTPPQGQAVKTEGTNMAVRRSVLVDLGGFDPAYHFYLDETDLNMRLARAGHATAIVPLAQVHHGFAGSSRRRTDRVPSDLFDIGASWAVFQNKFVAENRKLAHWNSIVQSERSRLLTHLISGGLEPGMVHWLSNRLQKGYISGQDREVGRHQNIPHAPQPFMPFHAVKRDSIFMISRPLRAKKQRDAAKSHVDAGKIVTLLNMSPTTAFHQVQFQKDGHWEQSGGLFGKSNRSQKLFRLWSRKRRSAFEEARVKAVRS